MGNELFLLKTKSEFFQKLDEQKDEWHMILFLQQITKQRRLALLMFAVERHQKLEILLKKFGENFTAEELQWFRNHFPGPLFSEEKIGNHTEEKQVFDLWIKVALTNNGKTLSAPILMSEIQYGMPQVVLMHMFRRLLEAQLKESEF